MRKYIHVIMLAAFSLASSLSAADEAPNNPPMKIGTVRPAIDFVTANGQHPDWDALKGKIVVLDFWATWCGPCIANIPKMNALERQFTGKGVVFYSITYEKSGAAQAFVATHPMNATIGLDNDLQTFKSLNAWGIPVVYIFDGTGKLIVDIHPDHLDAGVIDSVLAGKKPSFIEAQAWSDPAGAETYFRSLRDKQAN